MSNPKAFSKLSERTPSTSLIARTGDVLIQPSYNITSQTLLLPRRLLSDDISLDKYTLLQGQILSRGVKANYASLLYNAGHLEVQIEYSTGPSQITPNGHPSNLSYNMEWLAFGEAKRVLEQRASSIVSAESLEGEISYIGLEVPYS